MPVNTCFGPYKSELLLKMCYMEREFSQFAAAHDSCPEYVVTLGSFCLANENGIKGIHLKDFLPKPES
jgi:hypothetical protein